MLCGHGFLLQGDLVAEIGEAAAVVVEEALMVQAIEVLGAEVGVRDGVAEDVVGGDEQTVRDGDDRLLVGHGPLRKVLRSVPRRIGAGSSAKL